MSDSMFGCSAAGRALEKFARCIPARLCKTAAQQRRTLAVLFVASAVLGSFFLSNWNEKSVRAESTSNREVGDDTPYRTLPTFTFEQTSPAETDDDFHITAFDNGDTDLEREPLKMKEPDSDPELGGESTTSYAFSTPETTEQSTGEEPSWLVSRNATAYYTERRKSSCYLPQNPVYYFSKPVSLQEFTEKKCQKRLPQVVIAGMRKCGSGTLMRFLNMHPHVAVTNYEIHYFDSNFREGVDWYVDQMQFSTSMQVPIEKTPTYFFRPYDAPQKMRRVLSKEVKVIVILCDPIHRAVSDYLEFVMKRRRTELNNIFSRKYLAKTFENSVINRRNEIQVYNEIVDAGIYVKYVHRWMEYFPLKQMLFLDGDKFKVDPAAELRRVETFVGLRPFFRKEHFYLDPSKGFYCSNFPQPSCMNAAKGRDHPEVDPKVLKALCKFYTPYDNALETTLNQKFMWVGQC